VESSTWLRAILAYKIRLDAPVSAQMEERLIALTDRRLRS